MMAFFLFLIVFAITFNNGKARSITDKFITENMISSEEHTNGGEIFNLPTTIKQGVTITINGKLQSTSKLFKVTLRGDEDTTENCIVMFDFDKEIIQVESTQTEELESEAYVLSKQIGETFSLKITARPNEILAVYFEVNQLGLSSPVFCYVRDLRNFKYIEMQEGVARTDSLLFELSKYKR